MDETKGRSWMVNPTSSQEFRSSWGSPKSLSKRGKSSIRFTAATQVYINACVLGKQIRLRIRKSCCNYRIGRRVDEITVFFYKSNECNICQSQEYNQIFSSSSNLMTNEDQTSKTKIGPVCLKCAGCVVYFSMDEESIDGLY